MKKYLSLIFLAAVALCFSSCDDNKIANDLDGYWEGEVTSSTYWNYRGYGTYNYQYVDIEFFKDPYEYSSGSGVEYDYEGDTNFYTQSNFTFTVRNGYIYLDYQYGQDVVIENYSLSGNVFKGTFRRWVADTGIDSWNVGSVLADFSFSRVSNWRYERETNWRTRSGEEVKWQKVENPLKDK